MNDGCVLTGRHGRAHRHRPYQSPLYICAQSHTNKITIYTQSTQTKSTIPRAIHPNETVGGCLCARPNLCVAAFPYQKYTHCARGMNDGCALAGRRGRAHRHRPYPSPLYIRVQSSPTTSNIQTKRVNNPHTHRGRKCIAHSRPHYLK